MCTSEISTTVIASLGVCLHVLSENVLRKNGGNSFKTQMRHAWDSLHGMFLSVPSYSPVLSFYEQQVTKETRKTHRSKDRLRRETRESFSFSRNNVHEETQHSSIETPKPTSVLALFISKAMQTHQ